MKKNRLISLLLLTLLISGGIYRDHRIHPLPAEENAVYLPENEIHIPATAKEPPPPSLHAGYACVMDGNSGRILYGKDSGKKAPMASTTKIMTAILVLESGRMDETVTASPRAASMPKVHLGMRKGWQYRLEDLLYSLMLESHNDSAVAIAEHMAGSVEEFADRMNQKASQLGMTDSHFVTPNGLDAGEHYSTAADMCRLAAYAIQNKEFSSLVQTKSYRFRTIDGKHSYSITNKDAFLSYYEGALGIKTGFTNKAGYCFVGAARRDNTLLTSCVLASGWPPNKNYKWTDTGKLMDYGFGNYAPLPLPVQDLTAVRIPVEDGRSSFAACSQPEEIRTLAGRHEEIRVVYDMPERLYAPIRTNQAIGTITFYVGGEIYDQTGIFPSEDIERAGLWDYAREILVTWMGEFGFNQP